jgi:hypothetical protein
VADRYRLGVAALTAAVGAFLLVQLHAWPPHEDETLVLFISKQPFGELFTTVVGERGGAPLHFLLAHLVSSVWPELTGLRLISVVFAVASVPLIAALVARLTDRTTALVATLIASVGWLTLFHGIYARMYSLFLFASLVSFLLFLRAVARDDKRSWAAWIVASLVLLATQPYGALVLAVQAVYLAARRLRKPVPILHGAIGFLAVLVLATPLWLTYGRLADRFDVGVTGGGGSKLGSPVDVIQYLGGVVGDATVGWLAPLSVVGLVALVGLLVLVRTRPASALLALSVFAVPAIGLLAARSGASVSLESRHLIFAVPFLAMLLATSILRGAARAGRGAPLVVALALVALVASQVAWGWHKTPALYVGENDVRREARDQASSWLAATSRADDVYFGYEPVYLDAWEKGAAVSVIVQRADPKLALDTLRETPKPLGRGVWVFDATDQQDVSKQRLAIEGQPPGPAFEAKAFGPFLVIRTREPVRTVEAFFYESGEVAMLGKRLGIGDAGINHQTSVAVLRRLHGLR